MFKPTLIAITCVATPCLALSDVRAELIRPEGVAASSFSGRTRQPISLINGSGLSAESAAATHDNDGNNVWHASRGYGTGSGTSPVVADQWLAFTLPGAFDLTAMHVWQMNQGTVQERGVKDFSLEVSQDGGTWTPVLSNDSLDISPGGNISAQTKAIAAEGVRFVRFDIHSAHSGNANELVGLSEVRFEGTQVAAGPRVVREFGLSNLTKQPSSSDLLQGLIAESNRPLAPAVTAGLGGLTDGIGSNSDSHRVFGLNDSTVVNPDPWTLTYDLGLTSGQSANIDEINVYTYNGDERRIVDFDVEFSTDGDNWQYAFIGATNAELGSGNFTLTSLLQDDGGAFIEGARHLRFSFRPTRFSGNEHQYSALVEIDVFGSIVPEPSTYALGLLGAVAIGLLMRRRWCRA